MSCKNDHVSTIINFTLKVAMIFHLKYLYLKGNSKKHKVSFPGRFLPRNEKILVMASKIGSRLIHGIDLYSGKYGNNYFIKTTTTIFASQNQPTTTHLIIGEDSSYNDDSRQHNSKVQLKRKVTKSLKKEFYTSMPSP